MKKVIAKINFIVDNKQYIVGDEIDNLTFKQISKLNEKGYIEPLEYEDLVLIKRELEDKNKYKEEL